MYFEGVASKVQQYLMTLAALMLFSSTVSACELKVRIQPFAPLAVVDEKGNWSGMDIEFIRALLDTAGCSYQFVDVTFAMGINLMKTGQVDLMLNLSQTAQRESFMHFVGPYRREVFKIVSRKNQMKPISDWRALEQLKATLIIQRGAFLGNRLKATLEKNSVLKQRMVELADNKTRIELLNQGKVDGFFAEGTYLIEQFANNPDFSDFQIHPLVIHSAPVYYGFSKVGMSKEAMNKIRRAFGELAKTKRLQQIEAKYATY
ncbi:MAG: transporter substrate-binding domain-containing protein [Algicola sp.]|nr:transporter substrate-binding domain-containing protein [Algicola sp.]